MTAVSEAHSRLQFPTLPADLGDFADGVRRIFLDLDTASGSGGPSGECSPQLDMYETDDTIEIVVDLPAVEAAAIRVLAKGSAALIAGAKSPRRGQADSTFHLLERGFGRFARSVRLACACDTARARATLSGGELRVRLPKIAERRGRSVAIAVQDGTPAT